MTIYQKIIQSIDPSVNARHVEGFMRLEYGTLSHLSRQKIAREIKMFKATASQEMESTWESNARSFGL